jgi:hypothetical protein|tara:strand:+ start:928 stop:1056 length:129 start_codon:yes stop_codon:yes gene_type:complete
MPRTNERNKVQVHLSNAFGVGSVAGLFTVKKNISEQISKTDQ